MGIQASGLAAVSQALLAGVFLLASLSKVLQLRELELTLARLGIPAPLTRPIAVGVVATELVAAVALTLSPTQPWPRALVVLCAFGFALAGLTALVTRERIGCSCFGNMRQGLLGWRQIALLPCWLLLAAMAQLHPPTWSLAHGLLGLATLTIALSYGQVVRGLPTWRLLRSARLALDEDRALVFRIRAAKGESS